MGVLKCQILLEKPDEGFYRAGKMVTGTVNYCLEKPMAFRRITISFTGKGKCEWSESDTDGVSKSHSNKEEYTSQDQCIFKLVKGIKGLHPKGTFAVPFEFSLPEHLPSSIKNNYCNISYNIDVRFEKGNFFNTSQKFGTEICVYGYVNPCALEPLSFGIRKDIISVRAKQYVLIKAKVLRTLLTPGQNIYIQFSINNQSDVPINTIQTELLKRFTYISDSKTKYVEVKPLKATTGCSPGIGKKTVSTLDCIVPTLPDLYSIQNSDIILGEYRLRVTVKFPFPHVNTTAEIPIAIGHQNNKAEVEIANGVVVDED